MDCGADDAVGVKCKKGKIKWKYVDKMNGECGETRLLWTCLSAGDLLSNDCVECAKYSNF